MLNYQPLLTGKSHILLLLLCLVVTTCSDNNVSANGDENNPSDTTQTESRVPELQTMEVTNITKTSAQAKAKLISEGGSTVTERGIVWDTVSTPDVEANREEATSVQGSGEYSVALDDLTPDTEYHVRAYAQNETGVGYGEEVSFKTEIDPYAGFKDQIVDVNINARRQQFLGGGGATGKFSSNWVSMSASNRDKAARMVAQDINLKFAKTYPYKTPEETPSFYDDFVEVVNDLETYNPDIKVQVTVNNLPDHLEIEKGLYDDSIPGVLDSVATYYFRVLDAFKQRGLTVDQLDLLNEPGGIENNNAIYKGQLFAQAVPKLRAKINDASINSHGVTMPKIVGPSCWSVNQTLRWMQEWKQKLPAAFENTDIISTHGYRFGWVESKYREVFDLIDGKTFMNNEQTGRLQTGDPMSEYYDRGTEPPHIGDVSIALRITDAINGGVNHFFAFRLNNPYGNNAALIKTKNNQVSKSIIYDGYKQVTSLQPDGSSVLENTLIQTGGNRIVSFRKDDENKVSVHYTNVSHEEQNFSIALSDEGERLKISSVKVWVSDEQRGSQLALEEAYGPDGVTHYDFKATPFSVNSFEIKIQN